MVAKKPRFIFSLLLMVVLGLNLVNIQGEWIELSELLNRSKITEALNTSTRDELYQITRDKTSVFYAVLTTDRTGIFILVKK